MPFRIINTSATAVQDNEYLESEEFKFVGGFNAGQTDILLWRENESTEFITPQKGSIMRALLRSSQNRISGELNTKIYINDVAVTSSDLDCKLDASVINEDLKETAKGNITFSKKDKITIKATSTADWSPIDSDIELIIWFVLDFS